MESFIKWTITENVSRCSKRILATKKVQIEFFRSLMAYVLIILGFLDREVSNVTVHAVAQAAVQMKESDDQNASFVLEIDVAERCARKTCYNIPRWLLEGFVDYFVSVRSEFLHHGEGTPFERLLSETDNRILYTELFFVNSAGKSNFRPSHVVDQYMESVCINKSSSHPFE